MGGLSLARAVLRLAVWLAFGQQNRTMWHKSKPFSNIAFTRCFARADIDAREAHNLTTEPGNRTAGNITEAT
jgi:hypothetical protein